MDEVYSFCMARAEEKAAGGRASNHEKQTVRFLQDLRAAVEADPTTAGASLEIFQLYATRDRGHPDHKPEWQVEQ
ncbi:MAG TPA: hypothetical protein VFY58_06895 [Nocardioides sp.]|nr:hypothetical protein [Nocardioides sp.]